MTKVVKIMKLEPYFVQKNDVSAEKTRKIPLLGSFLVLLQPYEMARFLWDDAA